MEGRREEEAGPQDPEERPFGTEAAKGGPRHDAPHHEAHGDPWRPPTGEERLDRPERALHEAPVPGVGGESLPERGSGREVGQIEEEDGAGERDDEAQPQLPRQRREGGGRRELGERGGGGGEPRPRGPVGEEEEKGEAQEPQGLEVAAPRRLHHQEGRPEVEEEDESGSPPRLLRHPPQDPPREQVTGDPEELGLENSAPRERDEEEGDLGQGRVDRGHVGVVDPVVPRGADLGERGVGGGVEIRVDPLELDVSVPEVAVDVVGELGCEGEEEDPEGEAEEPDCPGPAPAVVPVDEERSQRVGTERGEEEEEVRGGEAGPGPPSQEPQGHELRPARGGQEQRSRTPGFLQSR